MLCRARGIGVLLAPLALLFLIDPNLQPRMCPQEPRSREKAQEEVYPPPVELYEAETIPFSAPPPLSFFTGIKCDLSSNIYLVYSDALPSIPSEVITLDTPLPPVRKVAIDSRTVVSYATQSLPDYPLVRREDFAVDPRGTVYALLEAYHRRPDKEHQEIPDYLIAKFKDDGTIDSFIKLQNPPDQKFEPYYFAAFPDGNFLVTGSLLSDLGEAVKWFTGIFNRGGVLVQEVKPSGDVRPAASAPVAEASQPKVGEQISDDAGAEQDKGQSVPPKSSARRFFVPSYSLMIGAPDGNVYLMRASNPVRIYALSPTGEVVHEWSVRPPRGDVIPMEMSLAGQNRLLLEFGHPATRKDSKLHMVLALLDLGTGKVTATYKLPEGRHGIPACMTPRDEFLVLGTTEDRKLKVVKFIAR